MKVKYKIMYPSDHPDAGLAGKAYKPQAGRMVVMNGRGIFFLFDSGDYGEHCLQLLSNVLSKYDVVWK